MLIAIDRDQTLGQISGYTYDGLNRLTAAGYGATAGSNQYTSSKADAATVIRRRT